MGRNVYMTYLWMLDTSYHTEADWRAYERMVELSTESMKQHLVDLDDVVVDENRVGGHDCMDMFRSVLTRVSEMCTAGHNVFCCDADVFAVKPINLFCRLDPDLFRMFWKTGVPNHPMLLEHSIPFEFNAGIKYFPAGIPVAFWEQMFEIMADISEKPSWATDQAFMNILFYGQNRVRRNPEHFLDNSLNWCPYTENSIQESEARLLHLHGSRSPGLAVEIMEAYNERD